MMNIEIIKMRIGRIFYAIVLAMVISVICYGSLLRAEKLLQDNMSNEQIIYKEVGNRVFNRIGIKNDRIERIIVNEGNAKIEIDEKLGFVHVKPFDKNVSLTINSEKGELFDLELLPKLEKRQLITLSKKDFGFAVNGKNNKKSLHEYDKQEIAIIESLIESLEEPKDQESKETEIIKSSKYAELLQDSSLTLRVIDEGAKGMFSVQALEVINPTNNKIDFISKLSKQINSDGLIADSSFIGAKEVKRIYSIRESRND